MNIRGKITQILPLQWVSVGLLTAVGIVSIIDRSTLAIANHEISGDLRLSPLQMGLLLSAFSWAYAFSQLPLGVLLDRIGARMVLGGAILVWSIAQLFSGLVNSLTQFLVARIFLGVGEAPTFPAGAKIIAEWFDKRVRGGPTGVFLSSTTIGPVIAPPIITALMLTIGWREMFVALGLTGIALSVIWYTVARDRPDIPFSLEEVSRRKGGEASKYEISFAELRDLLSQRSAWGAILGFIGIIYMIWLYLTWLPVYLEHERHLSIARVGWVVSIPYLFGTLGNLFGGYFADYLFNRGVSIIGSRKFPICIGLMGAAAFTIPVAYTPDVSLAVVYLCIVMFFLYSASGGAWALINVLAPREKIATVGALQNFSGYFGGSFAPIITGWLLGHTHSFRDALIISSGVAFTAALLYFLLVTKPIEDRAQISSSNL